MGSIVTTIRACLGVLFSTLVVSSCICAQESQMAALAERMASALSNRGAHVVAIFDFAGPEDMEAVRQKLASDFSAALAKSASSFRVQDRAQLVEILRKHQVVPGDIREAGTGSWCLRETGVDVLILGKISKGIGGLGIYVEAYAVADSLGLAQFGTTIPVTESLKALVGKNDDTEFASLPRGGKNGYSGPSCLYCPQPQFSEEALKDKYRGTVLLDFTVDEQGHVRDIRVKKAMPDGLTERAIKTVQDWKLKPAIGPDGKPAVVRQEAEITFHQY
jgi:TonB family protein